MKESLLPPSETERLAELARLDLLGANTEREFDEYTRLAAALCDVQFATVSLIDEDQQWFLSPIGELEIDRTPREESFCTHTILGRQIMEIPDAHEDPRFEDNIYVGGQPMIRFYAGAPLITSDGYPMGTLCVFDPAPKSLTDRQREGLALLAQKVVNQMEERLDRNLTAQLGQIMDASDLHMLMIDVELDRVIYSNNALRTRTRDLPIFGRECLERLLPELDYHYLGLPKLEGWAGATEIIRDTKVCFDETNCFHGRVRFIPSNTRSRATLVVLIQDKTELEHYQNEAETARSHARLLSEVARRTQNPVVVTDRYDQIEWVNPAFEKLTEYTLAEVRGKRPATFLQGSETSQEARSRIRKHLESGQPVKQEILNYSKSGRSYWLELDIQPVKDPLGHVTHFVAVETDVTRRKQQEDNYRKARDDAEKANRAKTRFLAHISHELRTPLNGIMGMAELLDSEVDDALKPQALALLRSGQHLFQILNNLLDISQIESGQFKLDASSFKPVPLVEEVTSLFRANAERQGSHLTLSTEGLADTTLVGDPTRLKQVLMNLVGNAVKFCEEGHIELIARSVDESPDRTTVRFEVRDSGPGIPEEDQKRIFETFEQSASGHPQKGTGLGLSIARQLVELMGGKLDLESRIGEGSCFYFEAPFGRTEEEVAPEATSDPQPLHHAPSIWLVDDDETNREVLKGMLQACGYERIDAFSSGHELLAALDDNTPDAIFMDLQMPGLDGFELAQRLRDHAFADSDSPALVACTAHTGQEYRTECLEQGFDEFLVKPLSLKALDDALRTIGLRSNGDIAESAPEPVPGIDATWFRSAFGNNSRLMSRFLDLFLDSHSDHTAAILDGLQSQEWDKAATAAHTLKGQLGYFGRSIPATETVRALEKALREKQQSQSESLLDRLHQNLPPLVSEANRLRESL